MKWYITVTFIQNIFNKKINLVNCRGVVSVNVWYTNILKYLIIIQVNINNSIFYKALLRTLFISRSKSKMILIHSKYIQETQTKIKLSVCLLINMYRIKYEVNPLIKILYKVLINGVSRFSLLSIIQNNGSWIQRDCKII